MKKKKIPNKKIYLIAFNGANLLDFTLEALNHIKSSDCIVFSKKVNSHLRKELISICPRIIYEEDIVPNILDNKKILWLAIYMLFQDHNKIIHLNFEESIFNNLELDEALFFKKKKIKSFILNQTIEIISIINRLNLPLTDRRKNSSVYFLKAETGINIIKSIDKVLSEKLIIYIQENKELESILKYFSKKIDFFDVFFISNKSNKLASINKEKIDEFLKGPNKTFNIKYLIIERK
tara:strand:- start:398 stop:1105 length:708 start_codon:yes stop_codon:yes gene_type:complete